MKKSIIILGGGISGLSVAWGLLPHNYDIHVIELQPEVGGLAGSFMKDGYVFDYGPHAFYTKDSKVYYKVKELMKDELLTLGEMYGDIKIIFQGRKYDYPLSITPVLANMRLSVLFQCTLDYLKSLFKRTLYQCPNKSFEDWVTNHFGKGLYNIFFGPFTEKTWGVSPRQLAANFASERIPKLNIWNMVKGLFQKNSVHANKNIHDNTHFNPTYSYYPKKGCWQLADSIKKQVESRGGMIHLSSRVKTLIIDDAHVARIIFDERGVTKEISPDLVVSTLPIPELTRVLEPLDTETKKAGLEMTYRELTLLFLQINKPRVFDARLVYFHDPDVLFQRGSEIKFLSEKTVPSKHKTNLTLEITNKDNLSDSKIYEESIKALQKLHLLRKQDVEAHYIVRQPYAYPIYEVNYKSNLA